jgi:serine/threonine protein kinase
MGVTPALPAALLAQYELVRPLGSGGMGTVWLVRDRMLDRLVALKVLRSDLTASADQERFLREARTAARLVHPHIVPVFRADETDGTRWFTMGFVDGDSIGDRLRDRGTLSPADVARFLREAASALAYAHARGVIHRDVKPDNLLIDRESGRVLVTDFGIARDTEGEASALTTDGNVLGTVSYMSPEQASGESLDGRSDVYALGVVGFHALTGTLPFTGTPQAVLVAHVTKPAPTVSTVAPTVPDALARVIDTCLAKRPADRYENAEAMAAALDEAMVAIASVPTPSTAGTSATLSEAEALAIWQRAAQLQAEAAHRMERTMSVQRVTGASSADANTPSSSFRATDVEAAAVEAGISRQYVAIALAERAGTEAAAPLVVTDEEDQRVTRHLGVSARSISESRLVNASPRATLTALRRIATAAPFHLNLDEVVGGHPLDGGILRFRVPSIYALMTSTGIGSAPPLSYRCTEIDLYVLNVTLAARGTPAAPACEIVVSGDLREGQRKNLKWSHWTAGITGTIFGSGALGIGAVVTSFSALAMAPAAIGVVGGVALARVGYRAAYRRSLRYAQEELQNLLRAVQRAVDEDVIFGGAFPQGSAPPARRGGTSNDDLLTML